MANLNKVMLIGRLTRDPDLRYTPKGTAVADLSLAINRKYKDPSGEYVEEAVFVDCVVWSKKAEVIAEYCSKGSSLYLEGRLQLDQWENDAGEKRSKMRVVVDNFEFLASKREAE